MTLEDHLPIADLVAFNNRRLSLAEHVIAGRHLLKCAECRNRLPLPTTDQFWRGLMGDVEDLSGSTRSAPRVSPKDFMAGIFGNIGVRNAAFAGLLLIAIGGLSWFLMKPPNSGVDENVIAALANENTMSVGPLMPNDVPVDRKTIDTDEPRVPTDVGEPNSKTSDKNPSKTGAEMVRTPPRTNRRQLPRLESRLTSQTRGSSPCTSQRFVVMDMKNSEAGLLVKWYKLKGALNYRLYLSDLDERLIDQFETPDRTSYLVTADLDKDTVYRLRLIATLENGERVISESQNFKIGNLTEGSIGLHRKTAASVRCTEVKQ